MKRIAFFIPTLHGGGAEKVVINLLRVIRHQNIALDLVVATAKGPYLEHIPLSVRTINLAAGRVIKAILPLAKYLQNNRPQALISNMSHANLVAVAANRLSSFKTQIILIEHNTLSAAKSKLLRARLIPSLMKLVYPHADKIVGVSLAVSKDLESELGLPQQTVKTIYNPVVDDQLLTLANAPLENPWFKENTPPVFLAVGRLTPQKDFSTLIQAFALVRKSVSARLVILGEGECRTELETMIRKLDLEQDIALPGFVDNPYAYMSRANCLVLSSRWEGLGNALIEAMACGCPVIATDCPSGPNEILEKGKYGHLVAVGNPQELSIAMLQVLKTPVNKDLLIQRAMYFSVDRAASKYLNLID